MMRLFSTNGLFKPNHIAAGVLAGSLALVTGQATAATPADTYLPHHELIPYQIVSTFGACLQGTANGGLATVKCDEADNTQKFYILGMGSQFDPRLSAYPAYPQFNNSNSIGVSYFANTQGAGNAQIVLASEFDKISSSEYSYVKEGMSADGTPEISATAKTTSPALAVETKWRIGRATAKPSGHPAPIANVGGSFTVAGVGGRQVVRGPFYGAPWDNIMFPGINYFWPDQVPYQTHAEYNNLYQNGNIVGLPAGGGVITQTCPSGPQGCFMDTPWKNQTQLQVSIMNEKTGKCLATWDPALYDTPPSFNDVVPPASELDYMGYDQSIGVGFAVESVSCYQEMLAHVDFDRFMVEPVENAFWWLQSENYPIHFFVMDDDKTYTKRPALWTLLPTTHPK